jgi:hypothetical protein
MGAKPGRFAEFVAPIAVRLARSQDAFVRSLTRLPHAVPLSSAPGEFDALLTLERRLTRDLDAIATGLRRVRRRPTLVTETHLADADQLYGADGAAVARTAIALGVPASALVGRGPSC